MPYPYAGAHQEHNARYLVEAGAAVQLDDSRLGELLSVISALLADSGRLTSMREAAMALARPEAAENIARLVVETATLGRTAGQLRMMSNHS